VPALKFTELRRRTEAESSEVIRERVNEAREIQLRRFEGSGIENNAAMDVRMIGKYCALDSACEQLMKSAYERLTLTARSYDRILRVARTIADLDGMENITPSHLAEAIQYRTYDFSIS